MPHLGPYVKKTRHTYEKATHTQTNTHPYTHTSTVYTSRHIYTQVSSRVNESRHVTHMTVFYHGSIGKHFAFALTRQVPCPKTTSRHTYGEIKPHHITHINELRHTYE